jgi:hypothetical protein
VDDEPPATASRGTYPDTRVPNGGYTILELPSREAALEWAAKIAVACRCSQEVRAFGYDPASSPGGGLSWSGVLLDF